jgi:hypothetical protein
MAEHTPTPWAVSPNSFGTQFIHGDLKNPHTSPMGVEYCELICGGDNPSRLTEVNAKFIVTAVNNHEPMVKALKEVHDFMFEDIKRGDDMLWAPAYESLFQTVFEALEGVEKGALANARPLPPTMCDGKNG